MSAQPLGRPHTEKERKFLLAIDSVEEITRGNLELFNKAESLTKSLEELYAALSGKVFDLAEVFHKLSANFRKLEGFMAAEESAESAGSSGKSGLSESYNFLKITLFAFSNSLKLNSESVLKQLGPFCSKNIEKIGGQKDMFKLKQSIELRHRSLCQRMELDSVIALVPDAAPKSARPVRFWARSDPRPKSPGSKTRSET